MPAIATQRRPNIRPRIKVWLEVGDEHAFCSGMCSILQAIDRTGSIKSAATDVGRSYRFVWGRLKKVEDAFGLPLVDSQVGGGTNRRSTLTPAGQTLLKSFTRLQDALHRTSDECAVELRRALRTGGD